MTTHKIALLPGDGIGAEVTPEARRVLEVVGKATGTSFEFEGGLVGGAAIDATGGPLPDASLRMCQQADAILFGAVGGPKWDNLPQETRPERGLLRIRKELDLFANLRPAKCFPMLVDASPLKRSVVEGTDLMVIRELTGGLYFGEPRGREALPGGGERAVNTMVYTTREIERVVRAAFDVAMKRKKRLASVDKSNVLVVSQLWRDTVNRLAKPSIPRWPGRARAGGQLRHGPGAQAHALRHHGDGEHLRGHPLRRGGHPGRLHGHAALPRAWAARWDSTSRCTGPRPTSRARGWPIPSPPSCPRPCCSATRSTAAPTRIAWRRRCSRCSRRATGRRTSASAGDRPVGTQQMGDLVSREVEKSY